MLSYKRSISVPEIRGMTRTPPRILEIGCNDGTDTLLLAAIPDVELYCFECDPRPIARFQANEQMPARVQLFQYALGAADGKASFHQSGGTTQGAHLQDWDLSGSLKQPVGHKERHKWCNFDRTIEVEVRTLDSWAKQFIPDLVVDFIWLDVQGAEGDVFAGGTETLKRTHYVYTEFNDWKKPLYEGDLNLSQTLAALGPAWAAVATYEYNVLCVNKEFARA